MSPVLNKNQRIAKNTVLLYIRMFFSMAVSLYTSRVILNVLGIENYGIYNIVGGVVVLFSFLSNALTQATQRFLTYALGEGNNDYFKKVFSISFFIYIGISFLVVVIAETFGLWLLYEKLVIPEGRFYAAMVTFQFSVLAFVINLMRIPYNAAIIAYERMSFYAYISIVEVVFKLLIVFFLYWSYYDKLIFYSLLVVIVTLLINGGYYLFCKFYLEGCKLNCYWNKKLFKDLMSFSGWSMLGSTSVIASNQGINILMNIYFGVVVNGAIGIANQVSNAVNQFVSNFQIAFNPQLIKSYASKDFVYLNKLTLFSAKFSFFIDGNNIANFA